MPVDPDDITPLVEALTGYLRLHRHAADTVEGIRDWWLPRSMRPLPSPEALDRALASLIKAGRLTRLESSSGRVLYINRLGHRMN